MGLTLADQLENIWIVVGSGSLATTLKWSIVNKLQIKILEVCFIYKFVYNLLQFLWEMYVRQINFVKSIY